MRWTFNAARTASRVRDPGLRRRITALLNYAYLRRTTKRLVEPEEIFVASTDGGAKV